MAWETSSFLFVALPLEALLRFSWRAFLKTFCAAGNFSQIYLDLGAFEDASDVGSQSSHGLDTIEMGSILITNGTIIFLDIIRFDSFQQLIFGGGLGLL